MYIGDRERQLGIMAKDYSLPVKSHAGFSPIANVSKTNVQK